MRSIKNNRCLGGIGHLHDEIAGAAVARGEQELIFIIEMLARPRLAAVPVPGGVARPCRAGAPRADRKGRHMPAQVRTTCWRKRHRRGCGGAAAQAARAFPWGAARAMIRVMWSSALCGKAI
jgi:hypothetical protein